MQRVLRWLKRIFLGILLSCVLWIIISNHTVSTLSTGPFGYEITLPLYLLLALTLLTGLLCGYAWAKLTTWQHTHTLRKREAILKAHENAEKAIQLMSPSTKQ